MMLTVTLNPAIDKTCSLDQYVSGAKNQVSEVDVIAGGKGVNVARMAHNLGVEVMALCLLGGTTGVEIGDLLTRDHIPYHSVLIQERSREIITVRERRNEVHTVFFEPGPRISEEEREQLLTAYERLLPLSELVVLGGALPSDALRGVYREMIILARGLGKKVILDSHGFGLSEGIEARPFMVKPNQEEASEILGRPVRTDTDVIAVARHLLNKGIEVVVVSLGKQGAVLATTELVLRGYPPTVEEVNSVGSGDSLAAGLAVGVVRGYSWEMSLRLGIAAGAANAAMWTAGSCTREQVETLLPEVRIVTVSPG